MAELVQSSAAQGRRPTFFGVDAASRESSNSIVSLQRKSIPRQDSQEREAAPTNSSKEKLCEIENSNKGSVQESPGKPIVELKPSRRYKPKQRGKILKRPRTIIVHLHNEKLIQLTFHFKAGEMTPVLRAQLVKDCLAKILEISPQIMDLFGVFSNTTNCPMKLLHNASLLPEEHSHFALQVLDFNWNGNQDIGGMGLELIASEIRNHVRNDRILPPLSKEQRKILNEAENVDFSSISEILKMHSCIVSNEAFAQPFPSLLSAEPASKMDIKLALDMKGIHFFDVTGKQLIMTFPWATISQVKSQMEPTCLFMFDIVVFDGIQFLRSIVVQTPHCEYLASVAESILILHCEKPEVAGIFEYPGKFCQKEPEYRPYSPVDGKDTVSFKECIVNGSSHEIRRIYSLSQCISNRAYESPFFMYEPERSEIPFQLEGKRYNIHFRTFQVIYYSKNTYRREVNDTPLQKIDPDMIFLTVPVSDDRSIRAKEVKMAVTRTLQLQKESTDLFGLCLHRSSTNTSLYLFSDDDAIPDGYYELVFRSLVFNWSELVDPVQWACIREDENATKLLFWEVMCAHGQLMNEVDKIFDMLTESCTLHDFVREMGAVADLHSVSCTLKKVPECISELVRVEDRAILSMDAGWLHLWRYYTGQRISSWNWNSISTIRRETTLNERVKFEIFVPNKSGKYNHQRYQTLSVETKCASYVMTVVGYILDGYKSRHERMQSKDVLFQSTLLSAGSRRTLPTGSSMKLTSVEFDEEKECGNASVGVMKTFVRDENESCFKNCLSCKHVHDISGLAGNATDGINHQFEGQFTGNPETQSKSMEMELDISFCDEDDEKLNMIGVEDDSLCTKVEYTTSLSISGEFLIKHSGTNGFRFLKDVLVQSDSRLIDVVGYYWNRNFTGSLGRRHRHKKLRNAREIISFRSILPEDGLFPPCYLELPQCCFSVSVPHLIRPLCLLAGLSQSDGRRFFSCFSTKPYRYRV